MADTQLAIASFTSEAPSPPTLSIVIPVFNEEENLRALHAALAEALRTYENRWEVIYVDDGSRDRSFAALTEIARDDPRVRVLRLRRNSGQTAAMAAGIAEAAGAVIV